MVNYVCRLSQISPSIIVALVAVASIAVVLIFGNQIRAMFAGEAKRLASDQPVQVLHRVGRQLVGVGQGQVGAGRPVQGGEAGHARGTERLLLTVAQILAEQIEFLPVAAAGFRSFGRFRAA